MAGIGVEWQVALVADHDSAALALSAGDQLAVGIGKRGGQIHDNQGEIGVGHGLKAALDAQRFDRVLAFADARGVDEFARECRRMAAISETRSRVVPGMSVTMARSCSNRRLKRLLLPTLGRPTMASVNPERTRLPIGEAVRRALRCRR